jgi:hypothetical protein
MLTESNTVEAYLHDLLSGPAKRVPVHVFQQPQVHYGRTHNGLGWHVSLPPTFPARRRKCWSSNGCARR